MCRAINYDEKDPFLCNSCGFSKYAKFELMAEAKACSAVDPIENEEDRKKVDLNFQSLPHSPTYIAFACLLHSLIHQLIALAYSTHSLTYSIGLLTCPLTHHSHTLTHSLNFFTVI